MGSHPHCGPGANPLAGGQGGQSPPKETGGRFEGVELPIETLYKASLCQNIKIRPQNFRQKIRKN